MTWLSDLVAAVAGLPGAVPPVPAALREAAGMTVGDEDEGWRPLSSNGARDLTPVTQARMQKLAVWQWESNLLARWLIETQVAFLLGEGVRLECDDEEARGWLGEFWADPINAFDITLEQKVRELALFGEQCWRVFRHPVSGVLRLGIIDPTLIDTVVTDPDNAAQAIGVVLRLADGSARCCRVLVAGDDDALFGPAAQALRAAMADGEVFFYRINGLSTGSRGRSDLLAAIDWCDAYERLLFGEVERAEALRSVLWDVTLAGATPEEVRSRAGAIETPAPMSVRVHNEGEAWSVLAPDLKGEDTGAAARLFRNHILGGCGYPEHWFGGGGDVNRASAAEMGEPVFKMLTRRQKTWKAILEALGREVIRSRAAALGRDTEALAAQASFRPRAVFPEITARDTSRYAAALGQVVTAAMVAVDRGLLSEVTAVEMIAALARQLGVEVDPAAEIATARAEATARGAQAAAADSFALAPLAQRGEGQGGGP